MDTSLKNKNKWRLVIGIVVGIMVTVGGFFAMWYIMQAKDIVENTSSSGGYNVWGREEFIMFINGKAIRYTTLDGQPNKYVSDMNTELAQVLAKYGEVLLIAGLALCMFLLVKFLRSKRIWKEAEEVHRKGIAYVA